MTAYPVTCVVDLEDGYRTTIAVEDGDAESGSVARMIVHTDRPMTELRVELSPEAAMAIERELRRRRLAERSGT